MSTQQKREWLVVVLSIFLVLMLGGLSMVFAQAKPSLGPKALIKIGWIVPLAG